jgi:hypothetical protein
MGDSISIHGHTPIELFTRPDNNAIGMILKEVLKCSILYFFWPWIDLFHPLFRLEDLRSTRILQLIFVCNCECLWSSVWLSLKKTHSHDSDISIGDPGEAIPLTLSHTPLRISRLRISFEITHFLQCIRR